MKKTGLNAYAAQVISGCMRYFLKERKRVRAGFAIEPLHRMRVASRRLRAALKVFKGFFPAHEVKALRKYVRKAGRALGKARELDIQLKFLESVGKKASGKDRISHIEEIAKTLLKERQEAQEYIRRVLRGHELEKKFRGVRARLKELSSKKDGITREAFITGKKDIVAARLDELLVLAPYVYQPKKVKELHRMRIAAKRLRYTLEIFEPLCEKKISGCIRAAHAIQDVLGDLHEFDVWIEFLNRDYRKASAYLEAECVKLRRGAYRKFVRLWESLEKKQAWESLRGFC